MNSLDFFNKLRAIFSQDAADPPDARKLNAPSEYELATSVQALAVGEKGWISLRDAWHLFSRVKEEYAFGETDEDGRRRLEEFAANPMHHSSIDLMPVEGRVYFTRQ
jgi:hypothetical protein